MKHKTEYSRPSVGASACGYMTLHGYNNDYFGASAAGMPPRVSGLRSNQTIVVPSYGGIGYNKFNQSRPTCSGYYNMSNAYPAFTNACWNYTSNLCG